MADLVSQDLVVKPMVESYLHHAKFPDVFTVTFRNEGEERRPDGYFHPSTHPLMGERQLFYYLTRPEDWMAEEISYPSRMAMIMGTAVHSFIQMCMLDDGVLVRPKGTCVACGKPHGFKKGQCPEHGAIDTELGRRGHGDGLLNLPKWGMGWFEFKTINDKAAIRLSDHNLDWLKEKKPEYYAQIQDYLDMTGLPKAIILFAVLGYPWHLVEIEVPYDVAYATSLRAKYRRVREAVASGEVPDACCAPLSKEAKACCARGVCPVGRLR
jgi:hypothetical protein